jgi:hypothetical protein
MSTLRNGLIQNQAASSVATDGIVHEALRTMSGRIGGCYDFESILGGINRNVECPDPDSSLQFTSGTVMVWTKTVKAGTQCIVNCIQNVPPFAGWGFGIVGGWHHPSFPDRYYDSLMLFTGPQSNSALWLAGDGSLDRHLSDGNWHHLAVTFDGTSAYFYYDGIWDGKTKSLIAPVVFDHPEHVVIGNEDITWVEPDTQGFFTGSIDEVKLFNQVLNADQVKLAGFGVFEDNFNDGAISDWSIVKTGGFVGLDGMQYTSAPWSLEISKVKVKGLSSAEHTFVSQSSRLYVDVDMKCMNSGGNGDCYLILRSGTLDQMILAFHWSAFQAEYDGYWHVIAYSTPMTWIHVKVVSQISSGTYDVYVMGPDGMPLGELKDCKYRTTGTYSIDSVYFQAAWKDLGSNEAYWVDNLVVSS